MESEVRSTNAETQDNSAQPGLRATAGAHDTMRAAEAATTPRTNTSDKTRSADDSDEEPDISAFVGGDEGDDNAVPSTASQVIEIEIDSERTDLDEAENTMDSENSESDSDVHDDQNQGSLTSIEDTEERVTSDDHNHNRKRELNQDGGEEIQATEGASVVLEGHVSSTTEFSFNFPSLFASLSAQDNARCIVLDDVRYNHDQLGEMAVVLVADEFAKGFLSIAPSLTELMIATEMVEKGLIDLKGTKGATANGWSRLAAMLRTCVGQAVVRGDLSVLPHRAALTEEVRGQWRRILQTQSRFKDNFNQFFVHVFDKWPAAIQLNVPGLKKDSNWTEKKQISAVGRSEIFARTIFTEDCMPEISELIFDGHIFARLPQILLAAKKVKAQMEENLKEAQKEHNKLLHNDSTSGDDMRVALQLREEARNILTDFSNSLQGFEGIIAGMYVRGDMQLAQLKAKWKEIIENWEDQLLETGERLVQLQHQYEAANGEESRSAILLEVLDIPHFSPRQGKGGKKAALAALSSTVSNKSTSPSPSPSVSSSKSQTVTQNEVGAGAQQQHQGASGATNAGTSLEGGESQAWNLVEREMAMRKGRADAQAWIGERVAAGLVSKEEGVETYTRLALWWQAAAEGKHEAAMVPFSEVDFIPTRHLCLESISRSAEQFETLQTKIKSFLSSIDEQNELWGQTNPDDFEAVMATTALVPAVVGTLISFKLFQGLGPLTLKEFLFTAEAAQVDTVRGRRLFKKWQTQMVKAEWKRFLEKGYIGLGGARTCSWVKALNFSLISEDVLDIDVQQLLAACAHDEVAVRAFKARREYSVALNGLLVKERNERLIAEKKAAVEFERKQRAQQKQVEDRDIKMAEQAELLANFQREKKRKVTFNVPHTQQKKKHKACDDHSAWLEASSSGFLQQLEKAKTAATLRGRTLNRQAQAVTGKAQSNGAKKNKQSTSPTAPTKPNLSSSGQEWLQYLRAHDPSKTSTPTLFFDPNDSSAKAGLETMNASAYKSPQDEVLARVERKIRNYNSPTSCDGAQSLMDFEEASNLVDKRLGLAEQMHIDEFISNAPKIRGEHKMSIGSCAVTKTAGAFVTQCAAALAEKAKGKVGTHTELLANCLPSKGTRTKKNRRFSKSAAGQMADSMNSLANLFLLRMKLSLDALTLELGLTRFSTEKLFAATSV